MSDESVGPALECSDPWVWTADAVRGRDDWLYRLTAQEIAELEAAVERVERPNLDLVRIDRDGFPLDSLAETLARLRRRILDGIGFVQIRGLPIARMGRRRAAIAFWGVARHLGDSVVAQNGRGDLLGHVRDLGQDIAHPTSRGPYTRAHLAFHCDPCDIVGLLCLHPARAGGQSSLACAAQVYRDMAARRPDLAAALARPVYRDRRGEMVPGRRPWYAMPVFNFHQGRLLVSHEPVFVETAARHFDLDPNGADQHEAIALLDRLCNEHRFDVPFQAGDMQFLHNYPILHSRRAFEDYPEPQRKRHLLRIWLLNRDGWPVPNVFYERFGSPETTGRPGGFAATESKPCCRLEDL